MPYCSQCGVEVDETVEFCPLCRTTIQKTGIVPDPDKPYPPKAAGSPSLPPLSHGEKMAIARTITILGFLIPILFVSAIDFFINRAVTWSSVVDLSLTGILFIVVLSLFLWKRPYMLTMLIHTDIMIYLVLLTLVTGQMSWLLPVGMPIVLSSALLVCLTVFIISRFKNKGSNVAGVILLHLALFCGVIDISLARHFMHDSPIGWSIIVVSILFPTAVLLFYLQSARFSHSKLRRFFHF